jgi:hexosaminidase
LKFNRKIIIKIITIIESNNKLVGETFMKIKLAIAALLFIVLTGCSGDSEKYNLVIIPYPTSIEVKENRVFELEAPLGLQTQSLSKPLKDSISAYLTFWNDNYFYWADESKKGEFFPVEFNISKAEFDNPEAYRLEVGKKGIKVEAATEAGLFYGFITLKEVLHTSRKDLMMQELSIVDIPKVGMRSFMLDEARYFFGKDFVKNLLVELAHLKINTFHWHLTDDAGWRIEIKKYPLLTEVGATRTNSQIGGWDSEKRSNEPHSGFYTQEDIKEIVEFAAALNINIIPEINMPGHATAALAAYPEHAVKRENIRVPATFGKHPNSFNIANENTITFLQDILSEVVELFPSEIIHIGGDEVLFDYWQESNDINRYKEEHDLASLADVHIHFCNRIADFLRSKGKRMMAWNEVLGYNIHGFDSVFYSPKPHKLSKDVIVHFWKGDDDLLEKTLNAGYEVVHSQHQFTYFDYSYKDLPLEKAYRFMPRPESIDAELHELIIGAGAQLWSEWTPTQDEVIYQSFPRIAAFSQICWGGSNSYDVFRNRLVLKTIDWNERNLNAAFNKIH